MPVDGLKNVLYNGKCKNEVCGPNPPHTRNAGLPFCEELCRFPHPPFLLLLLDCACVVNVSKRIFFDVHARYHLGNIASLIPHFFWHSKLFALQTEL